MNNPSAHQTDSDQRAPLEVLAAEYAEKMRTGKMTSIDDYVRSYPELESEIRELFPTILALENMKISQAKSFATKATMLPLKLKELGDFEIIREIGRGGMGIVFEALQRSLQRHVALKVLPKAALLDPQQLQRFSREAHIAAKLHHSHLVSLHGAGEHDGYHFLVMELVAGASLDKILPVIAGKLNVKKSKTANDEPDPLLNTQNSGEKINLVAERIAEKLAGPLDREPTRSDRQQYFRQVAEIGRDAAGAIDYAFEQGVLHRDIKPANLILDDAAHVWVSDFGMARSLEGSDTTRSRDPLTKTIGGTFAYMSPESFDGQLTRQSDVYSLGITLYEMLTLQPVDSDKEIGSAIRRLADTTNTLPEPRKLDPTIPKDLETIVLKAISKRTKDRYQTALLLVDDLQRFLDGRPVTANRTSLLQHTVRWCNRNRLSAALLTSAAALLVLLGVVLATGFYRAQATNTTVKNSLMREIHLRKQSQHSLNVATEALDRIYHELVPDDLNISAYVPSNFGGEVEATSEDQTRSLAVSMETAAILDDLIDFYQQLANEFEHRGPLAESTIRSLGRIGDIYFYLGDFDQAADRYQMSLEKINANRQHLSTPTNGSVEEARILNQLGIVYRRLGADLESISAHIAALDLLTEDDVANNFSARFQLARTHYLIGRDDVESAAMVAAGRIGHSLRTPDLIEREDQDLNENLGKFRWTESEAQRKRKKYHVEKAIEILRKLDQQGQQNSSCQFLMGCCARELNDPTVDPSEIFTHLVDRFPGNPHYRYELVETLRAPVSATRDPQRQRPPRGGNDAKLKLALGHTDWLVRHYPDVPQYQLSRMHVLHRLGHIYNGRFRNDGSALDREKVWQAIEFLTKANDQADSLADQWPGVGNRLWSVVVKASLADALLRNEEMKYAAEVIYDAAKKFEDLVKNETVDKQSVDGEFAENNLEIIRQILLKLAGQADSTRAIELLKLIE